MDMLSATSDIAPAPEARHDRSPNPTTPQSGGAPKSPSPHTRRHRQDPIGLLASRLKGDVLTPSDADYDVFRAVVPGNHDPRPQAVIRVADAADVAAALRLAAASDLEVAVRSGGHSGHVASERGIVIDLRKLDGIEIDQEAGTAWVGAGLTAGAVTAALEEHGLVVGFGDTASVGVGGLTLGGGIGYLVRKHGLTIDSVLAAEVVTADGRILRADENQNADLFWALRGGGGNFGVVTRWKYRAHPLPDFTGGLLVLPATPEVISRFVTLADTAPEELSAIASVMAAPPLPFLPADLHGSPVLLCMMAYAGEPRDAERALSPFRALAPLADFVTPGPYSGLYMPEDPGRKPAFSVRSRFMNGLGGAEAERIIGHVMCAGACTRLGEIRVLGGAMARVPVSDTAFAHRKSRVMFSYIAVYDDPAEQGLHDRWAEDGIAALPQEVDRVYVNFLLTDPAERIHAAYPRETLDRLRRIKNRYDPANLFRLNRNVLPR
jgi:FAD/FMN-containing dehydrogenase